MSIENPFSKQEEMQKRIIDLKAKDNHYEDSVYDLAKAEDEHRELLKSRGIVDKELRDELANIHSNVVLEKMESGKERWIDELTGMKNRTALEQELPRILNLESRAQQECSILMLDFDHFKQVNDNYGHQAGDQALQQLVNIIEKSIRESDFIYRYGGEEFVILLSGTTSETAKLVAEKIRLNVEQSKLEVVGKDGQRHELHKTISLGGISTDLIPQWKNKNADNDFEKIKSEMIQSADKALYKAKEEGRNRFIQFHQ